MTNLNKSLISSIETLLPIIYLDKVSGIPPRMTFYFPNKDVYKALNI